MTTNDAILSLFVTDEVVLRASEIIRRTGAKEESVRKSLWRLVKAGHLFRIGLCQYATSAAAKPISKMRGERMAALERRLDVLEGVVTELRIAVRRIREDIGE